MCGKKAVRIVWILNVVMQLVMLALARPIASIYHFSGETNSLLIAALMAMAITITPKMIGSIYIVGILRAGGDTAVSYTPLDVYKRQTEYGGAGGDHISYAITVEELSRVCASTGVICAAHTSLCCWPIFNWGNEDQKRKSLPGL